MTMPRSTQTGVFLVALAGMIFVQTGLAPDLRTQALILAPAVAVLGLPHGALDLPMAERLWSLHGARGRTIFFAGYLALAGSVGLLWWLFPAAVLALFLSCSALHFSQDWVLDGRLWRIGGGLSAVGATTVFHQAEVAQIFVALGANSSAVAIAQGAAVFGLLGAACAVAAVATGWPHLRRSALLEVAAIWVGAILLPPLLYFVVYFCFLHSVRHLMGTLALLADQEGARRSAAWITAVTLAGAGIGLTVLILGVRIEVETSLMQVVFVGLAALTMPHMLLEGRFTRSEAAARKSAGYPSPTIKTAEYRDRR